MASVLFSLPLQIPEENRSSREAFPSGVPTPISTPPGAFEIRVRMGLKNNIQPTLPTIEFYMCIRFSPRRDFRLPLLVGTGRYCVLA